MNDPYLWLEDIEGEEALGWVHERNQRTVSRLESESLYRTIEQDIRNILLAKDRIPYGSYRNGYIYNFWQDDRHVRGIWRRTPLAEYKKKSPRWETLIDIDQLAKIENENWVYKGVVCLPPENNRCLLSLSRGGKDAVTVREFDVQTRSFVKGGFELPEAKSHISWIDQDTIFVGTELGPDSLTKSGYPRQVRLWKRGENLANSRIVLEASVNDLSAAGYTSISPEGTVRIVTLSKSIWQGETYLMDENLKLKRLPIPDDARIHTFYDDQAFFVLQSDWKHKGQTFLSGSLIAMSIKDFSQTPELVIAQSDERTIETVARTRSGLFVQMLENVRNKIFQVKKTNGNWEVLPTKFASNGDAELTSLNSFDDILLASFQDFLTPPSVLFVKDVNAPEVKPKLLKSLPDRFKTENLIIEQNRAKSADGTMIPYFIVRPKNLKLDRSTPTVLYGYGGFLSSLTPHYLGSTGKVWSERGGAYVIANIRGGGEFGPRWHQAALKENRQKAFDDFIAVAEDLIARKITSPAKLAIEGGSNGGLLVGATFTQRPELFRAVICQVPLLDMLRYHKLLAGHSWMEEYGNPDVPKEAEYIRRYSPYQNVRAGVKYPKVFFMTSTKDDRVHPGHARKMAARMEELGHEFEYFENIDGGHGGAANQEERIKFDSLVFTFLSRELGLE